MVDILWESKEKNHNGTPYLTVKRVDGYLYSERAGVDSVAFVLYDTSTDMFCALNEQKPPLFEANEDIVSLTTAFGGSLDDDSKSPLQILIDEVREEAGYNVIEKDCINLGRVFVSTQSNQMCHLYLVLVNDRKKCDRDPQTEIEALSTLEWFTKDESFNFCDWKITTIIAKYIGRIK